MNARLLTTVSAGMIAAASAMAYTIDWEKIKYWTGEGPNKAALVVHFDSGDKANPGSVVWGYRWAEGEEPTGYDMITAIAANSADLGIMTQFTGPMGYTLNGIGYAPVIADLFGNLIYDFDGACGDTRISFGLLEPNEGMNQTSAPGGEALNMALEAIDAAKLTHIINHPFNQSAYGYACYDYDWWKLNDNSGGEEYWNAGWYDGYWSYWTGGADLEELSYSGLGMSSVYLEDGDVNGWYYTQLDEPIMRARRARGVKESDIHSREVMAVDGFSGPSTQWGEPNYTHFATVGNPSYAYKNVVGSGSELIGLTMHWGDDLALDNLTEGVFVPSGSTVADVLATALREDPRFYALTSGGEYVAFGFDTNGDNSAAITIDGTPLTLSAGVGEHNGDCSAAVGSSAYDHWKINGSEGSWKVFVNGKVSPMSATVNADDNLVLEYTAQSVQSELPYTFYLRPADVQGVWMQDECVINTENGKQAFFPMIANTLGDSLYGAGISAEVYSPDNLETVANGLYSAYIANAAKGAMSCRLTVTTPVEAVVRPYLNIRKDWDGTGKQTVKRIYGNDAKVSTIVAHPLSSITLEGIEPGGVIELPNMGVQVITPVYEPANADFTGYSVKFGDESVVSIYTNVNSLVAHNAGETTMTLCDKNGNEFGTYTIRVKDVDPSIRPENYTDGMIWLNEEWFTHTSGSLNYIDQDGTIYYRAYGEQNNNMAFGATSQFGTVYADKLIVISKQAWDPGDSRPLKSGGRVVVVDANTMRHIGAIDEIGGDGRSVVGITPSKAYLATNKGIRVMNLDDITVADADIEGVTLSRSGQIGDMVKAGRYVFAANIGTGLVIIDTTDDSVVKTIADTGIQGVALSKDGRVWMADAKKLTPIDPETLEVGETYSVPGNITCCSGSWRHVNLMASPSENILIWSTGNYNGHNGAIYCWNLDEVADPSTLQPIFTPSSEFISAYGSGYASMGYDHRSGTVMFCTMPGFGAKALHNWYHFINVKTGEIKKTVKLPLYWWFPAMPINPDKYAAEIKLDNILLTPEDIPVEFDLTELVSDPDNIDYNINVSLLESAPASDETVSAEVTLTGKTLKVTPKAVGKHTFTLVAESNGKISSKDVEVNVSKTVGVNAINGNGNVTYTVVDASGLTVGSFDSSENISVLGLQNGVYMVKGSDGSVAKYIVKK